MGIEKARKRGCFPASVLPCYQVHDTPSGRYCTLIGRLICRRNQHRVNRVDYTIRRKHVGDDNQCTVDEPAILRILRDGQLLALERRHREA